MADEPFLLHGASSSSVVVMVKIGDAWRGRRGLSVLFWL
jgi:hypothetical protein